MNGQLAGPVLLRNGHVFAPEDLGELDILMFAGRIVRMGQGLHLPEGWEGEEHDLRGMSVVPGFVDGHIHIAGSLSGEFGPRLAATPLQAVDLVQAGITTAVGVLGFDDSGSSPLTLLARARVLREQGLTAYMFTGSILCPGPTITGDFRQDIRLIPEVLGVKIAIAEPAGSHPDIQTLARMAGECAAAGAVAGKLSVLHVHTGNGPEGLEPLFRVVEITGLSPSRIVPTHVNGSARRVQQAAVYARLGGIVDLTASLAPEYGGDRYVKPAQALATLIAEGAAPSRITMSSDTNVTDPVISVFPGQVLTVNRPEILLTELCDIVRAKTLPFPAAIALVTANPARVLGLVQKGRLAVGADADITVLDPELHLRRVYAGGRLAWAEGKLQEAIMEGKAFTVEEDIGYPPLG